MYFPLNCEFELNICKKDKMLVKNEDKLFKKIYVIVRITEILVTKWVEIISSY